MRLAAERPRGQRITRNSPPPAPSRGADGADGRRRYLRIPPALPATTVPLASTSSTSSTSLREEFSISLYSHRSVASIIPILCPPVSVPRLSHVIAEKLTRFRQTFCHLERPEVGKGFRLRFSIVPNTSDSHFFLKCLLRF